MSPERYARDPEALRAAIRAANPEWPAEKVEAAVGHALSGQDRRSRRADTIAVVFACIGLFVSVVGVSVALLVAKDAKDAVKAATTATALAERQREGRGIALDVVCAALNGVERAGKATLTAPIGPPRFRRSLERLGLPAGKVRRVGQRAAARAYALSISQAVARQIGPDAANDVINRDGTMNCSELRNLARAAP